MFFEILFVAVLLVLMAIAVGTETYWGAFVELVLGTLVFFWIFDKGSPVEVLKSWVANPFQILGFVAFYVVAGLVVSFVKWIAYAKNAWESFDKFQQRYDRNAFTLLDITKQYRDNVVSFDIENGKLVLNSGREYSSTLVFWVIWWPFVLVNTIVGDYLVRFLTYVMDVLKSMYISVANSAMSKIDIK